MGLVRGLGWAVRVVEVAAGWGHSLVRDDGGRVYSWGFGGDGQLGHGDLENSASPRRIETEARVSSIYAGHSHSGFITS